MSKPIIRYVKDFNDIPHNENGGKGAYSPWDNTIYLVKGKSPESTKYHETYHAMRHHPQKPRDPLAYAQQEIEANLYAYRRCGQPKRILMRLKGIYNDMLVDYDLGSSKTLILIRGAMHRVKGVPRGWHEDIIELQKQVARVNRV